MVTSTKLKGDDEWITVDKGLQLEARNDIDVEVFLTFDLPLGQPLPFGQYIYSSNLPAGTGPIYHISHPLAASTGSISVRLSYRRPDMSEYPLETEEFLSKHILFHVERAKQDYQELTVRAGTQSSQKGLVKRRKPGPVAGRSTKTTRESSAFCSVQHQTGPR